MDGKGHSLQKPERSPWDIWIGATFLSARIYFARIHPQCALKIIQDTAVKGKRDFRSKWIERGPLHIASPPSANPGCRFELKSRLQGRSPSWRQSWRPEDAGRPNSARPLPMKQRRRKKRTQFQQRIERTGGPFYIKRVGYMTPRLMLVANFVMFTTDVYMKRLPASHIRFEMLVKGM